MNTVCGICIHDSGMIFINKDISFKWSMKFRLGKFKSLLCLWQPSWACGCLTSNNHLVSPDNFFKTVGDINFKFSIPHPIGVCERPLYFEADILFDHEIPCMNRVATVSSHYPINSSQKFFVSIWKNNKSHLIANEHSDVNLR